MMYFGLANCTVPFTTVLSRYLYSFNLAQASPGPGGLEMLLIIAFVQLVTTYCISSRCIWNSCEGRESYMLYTYA